MRLKYQLFIALLIASALLVALMFAVSSISFSRGFLGYINNATEQRIESLALELETQYAEDGSWDNIANNPSLLRSRLRSAANNARQRPENDQPLPRNQKPDIEHNPEHTRGRTSERRRNRRLPPERILQRLVFTDKNKETLVGRINITDQTNWYPINNNEKIVGYIGTNKLKQLDNQLDRAFERQQRKSFALGGLAMVLLSALLAALLASRIVKPILKVKKTVAELSDGNFRDRISTNRRDEIGDLSRDINKLGVTLESNKDARQRHFAEISHELRTPVGVLQAELEALQDGIRPLNQSAVDSLHTETLRLNRLIEDLQTLSLADAGALDYQMQLVDIKQCIDTQIERHRQVHPDLSIETTVADDALLVNADPQRLQQLLDNLFQNTARYTNLPGKLVIALTTDNNVITLVWKDSAPGVSTDALHKLFNPLFRTENSRNREHGGSGLGLSIVSKIVEAHNGTCSANHSDLGGLEIKITLSAAEPS